MKAELLDKFFNKCVYAISFFLFSGFYAVLALAITFFGSAGSRLVTVPMRLLTTTLMLVVIALTFLKKRESQQKQQVVNFVFLLFWSFYFLKVFWHWNSGEPLRSAWFEYIFYAINFVILPFYMFGRISFAKHKKTIIDALIFSGFAMGLTTLYLYKDILMAGVSRINLYIYQNPDFESLSPLSLSYASVLTIVLCVYQLLYKNRKSKTYRIYLLLTIGLSLVMFLLGASRGSLLGLAVSILYMVLHSNYKMKIKWVILVIGFIPIFIWSVAVSGSSIIERTTSAIGGGSTGREELWSNAFSEFISNPIVGGRIEIGFYPHNMILEILMATGLIGLLIISILFVKGFIRISYLPKLDSDYLWVAIIFLQGFCQYFFSAALYQSTLVFFPLGIILAAQGKKKHEKMDREIKL